MITHPASYLRTMYKFVNEHKNQESTSPLSSTHRGSRLCWMHAAEDAWSDRDGTAVERTHHNFLDTPSKPRPLTTCGPPAPFTHQLFEEEYSCYDSR